MYNDIFIYIISKILIYLLVYIILKSIFIGSDFNWYYFFKYKKVYTDWYFYNRKNSFKIYIHNKPLIDKLIKRK
jgi:hypothetical protein